MQKAIGKAKPIIFAILVVTTILLVGRVSMMPVNAVEGENITTNVSVGNSAPTMGVIVCDPISDGNFTPDVGANKSMSCWTVVIDDNGYGEVNQTSLDTNFYSDSIDGADDLNTHYSNGTSSNVATDCTWTNATGTNITVNCTYYIRYFIDPSAGGWTVNFTVNDTSAETGSAAKVLGVATTLGLDVINTSIEFGSLALGGESQRTTDVLNTCNQQIDVKLRESQNSGYLDCPGATDIATDNGDTDGIKYNATTFSWPEGISLTDTSTAYTAFDLNYYDATGTSDGESTKTLYWRIKIPSAGVSGVCTGQTEFVAVAG
ncbi:MAG: hypothetical protein JW727_06680 [Candidatus Aenigmarchaeota archaeon]|nr:hypothetical protein [Candidatus Aenigmarchaeota archaeon]